MHGLVAQAAGSSAFYRLIKRPFSQLQVLMPGETAAPNTPTGKTGTPNIQAVGLPFTVTVNAVDADWNVVSSATDTVDITSNDTTAGLPADAALANGTGSFSFYFGQPGTNWTVTATDVTDPTKTANTGSPTVAQ